MTGSRGYTRLAICAVIVLGVVVARPALADWGPGLLSVEGSLLNLAEEPLEGPVDMQFYLYPDPADLAPVWAETHLGVELLDGRFQVVLGKTLPLDDPPLFELYEELWISLAVDGGAELPTVPLTSVGYSFQAKHAAVADTLSGAHGCVPGEHLRVNGTGDAWECAVDQVLDNDGVDALVADNGFALIAELAVVAFTGSYADLLGKPKVLDLLGLTGDSDFAFGGSAVISAEGKWVGDPTGLVGPQGASGEKGDPGIQGTQGEKGDKGDKGDTGAQGLQGLKGDKGDKGDLGAQGLQGLKGDKGDKGDIGAQGVLGVKGDKGDIGATGLQGPKGDKGDIGAQGPQGDPRATYTVWGTGTCASNHAKLYSGHIATLVGTGGAGDAICLSDSAPASGWTNWDGGMVWRANSSGSGSNRGQYSNGPNSFPCSVCQGTI